MMQTQRTWLHKALRFAIVLFVLALALYSYKATHQRCAVEDKPCLRRTLDTHLAHQVSIWEANLRRPVRERISPAPSALVDMLVLDNLFNGYRHRPRAAVADAAFLRDLDEAISSIPQQVWSGVEDRLAGLFLVDDLGGTAYTSALVDSRGREVAAYVVLDVGVLSRLTANQWASWKEYTPFRPDGVHTLQAHIEEPAQDSRVGAIRYILLHELGHVFSVGRGLHPSWERRPSEAADPSHYPFFRLSWRVDRGADSYSTRWDDQFPQRARVVYYFGPKLDAAEAGEVYTRLAATGFPSLYAATSPGDDFAESFANYVHTVILGWPWRIVLMRNGEPVQVVGHCWDEPRCAAKRALLERMLNIRSPG